MKPIHDRRLALPAIFQGLTSEQLDKFEFLSSVEGVDIYIDREDHDDYLMVFTNRAGDADYLWMLTYKMMDGSEWPDYLVDKKKSLLHETGTRRDSVIDFISTHFKLLQ